MEIWCEQLMQNIAKKIGEKKNYIIFLYVGRFPYNH